MPRGKGKPGQKMVNLSLAVALLLPLGPPAFGQFEVNCTRGLDFDSIAGCGGGGKLTITPGGGVMTKGCVAVAGAPAPAQCLAKSFVTTGTIQIKVTAKNTQVKGAGTMTVGKFNIGTVAGGPTKTYTDADLTATPLLFKIGGQLQVSPTQAQGNYSGKMMIKVMFTP